MYELQVCACPSWRELYADLFLFNFRNRNALKQVSSNTLQVPLLGTTWPWGRYLSLSLNKGVWVEEAHSWCLSQQDPSDEAHTLSPCVTARVHQAQELGLSRSQGQVLLHSTHPAYVLPASSTQQFNITPRCFFSYIGQLTF